MKKRFVTSPLLLCLVACPGDDGGGSGTATDSSSTSGTNTVTASTAPATSMTATATTAPTTTASTSTASTTGPTSTTDPDTSSGDSSSSTTGVLECPYDEVAGDPDVDTADLITGFSSPVLVVGDPVETDVLYVLEQAGEIKRIPAGVTEAPAEDWLSLPVISNFENGMLGLAFHPDYSNNGLIYVAHTPSGEDGNLFITEFSADSDGVNLGSARNVIAQGQPAGNHNGGMIQFGPDDLLYISVGDGGEQDDGCSHGQNVNTYLGKILRIDPTADGNPDSSPPCPFVGAGCGCSTPGGSFDYTIPNNPDFGGRPELWSIGYRNPWRMSFDPVDGRLFVADVGQDAWEEVTIAEDGTNAGWGDMEGAHCFNDGNCDDVPELGDVNSDGLTLPVAEYFQNNGRCSVIGLGNYRSCEVPAWDGRYFYGDLCTGEIWSVTVDPDNGTIANQGVVASAGANIFGGGYNAYGDVYVTMDAPAGADFVARIAPAG